MKQPQLFGIPRSGGTVIYNICRVIWGDEHIKPQSHEYFEGDRPVIATYRDFRDTLVSQWRSYNLGLEGRGFDDEANMEKMSLQEALFHANDFKRAINRLDHFKADEQDDGRKVLFLCYENFFDNEKGDLNFEYIFETIETFFDMEIGHATKRYIKQEFNFNAVKEYSKQFSDFNEYDKKTHVHGHHLFKGAFGTWKNLIPSEHHEAVTASLRDELTRWNYEL